MNETTDLRTAKPRGREEVELFAAAMLEKMAENAHKPDLADEKWTDLMRWLEAEVEELSREVIELALRLRTTSGDGGEADEVRKRIRREAADVGILAMGLAKKAGALEAVTPEGHDDGRSGEGG